MLRLLLSLLLLVPVPGGKLADGAPSPGHGTASGMVSDPSTEERELLSPSLAIQFKPLSPKSSQEPRATLTSPEDPHEGQLTSAAPPPHLGGEQKEASHQGNPHPSQHQLEQSVQERCTPPPQLDSSYPGTNCPLEGNSPPERSKAPLHFQNRCPQQNAGSHRGRRKVMMLEQEDVKVKVQDII